MIRHKILDIWVKEDNPASQEVFRWFKYSIEKDYKSIEILSDIKTRKDETEYIKHRLVLKYDNGCISTEVIDMIIKDRLIISIQQSSLQVSMETNQLR